MIVAMGLFFLMSISATAFIELVRRLAATLTVLTRYALVNKILGEAGFMWDIASYGVPFGLSLVAFVFAYWIIPAERVPLRLVLPGAVVAAMLFESCKSVFVLYLSNFARYDLIFGSLAAVTAFLFWVYLSALILLFGAEVASELPRMSGSRAANR
jgi:YihY family inner membrane protein